MFACQGEPTPYRPPTAAAQPARPGWGTAIPSATESSIQIPIPQVTPACTDNLTYLEGMSLPDGTVVHPGEQMDKRWLVENSGTCPWDDRYRLKLISGANFDTPIEQALYPARSGTKAILRIIFMAPSEPGAYESAWQAYNPQGSPFGDPIYIRFIVGGD